MHRYILMYFYKLNFLKILSFQAITKSISHFQWFSTLKKVYFFVFALSFIWHMCGGVSTAKHCQKWILNSILISIFKNYAPKLLERRKKSFLKKSIDFMFIFHYNNLISAYMLIAGFLFWHLNVVIRSRLCVFDGLSD